MKGKVCQKDNGTIVHELILYCTKKQNFALQLLIIFILNVEYFIKLPMYIRQKKDQSIKIRDHPLQRSESVSGIIHGSPKDNPIHYVDSLERFKRDYATIDKEQRQKKRQTKKKDDEKRRNLTLLRENQIKNYEEENLNKIIYKQKQSQILHELGAKRTAHTHSIPVNPINMNYENNERGRRQEYYDEQSKINKLVRSHHLQTCGNSGYNIINGRNSVHIDSLVPHNSQQVFEEKLGRYYSQFRMDPNQHQ